MNINRIKYFFSLSLLTLLGASCLSASTGGIWYSPDGGQTWEQRSVISFQGRASSLASSSVLDLAQSASVPDLLYAATNDKGVFKSDNHGETWFPVTTSGSVQSVDVSAINPLDVVATRGDQVFLTRDGGEEWRQVYTNPSDASISDIAFDPGKAGVLMMTLTSGELLRSDNFGTTWQNVTTFDRPILKLVLNGTSEMYLLTTVSLYRSIDSGRNWVTTTMPVKASGYLYSSTVLLTDLLVHPQDPDALLLLAKDGIYSSINAGETWTKLPLLAQGQENRPLTIGWDPKDRNTMYYANRTVLYKSENSGQSWQTIAFPAALSPRLIRIHPSLPDELFLGAIPL